VVAHISGINEACQEDEQSPDPRELTSIKEESKIYVYPRKKCDQEVRISEFLDKIRVTQVFPGEINAMMIEYYLKNNKRLTVPSLCLGKNSLFDKRKSNKLIQLRQLA